ncbi:glycosyltransferase [Croceitalea sp. MTPC9]|uniref:glycosyltransferase n=1 Tax=unclassified Croceitalea TaxID=2632280 RepID=UPI002B36ED58|nr:glycosyltransferase [Croceitalea sp. MTPC6]GMN15972.1 glycosyltransferase [Croceitalea sp. MTPC9]
MKLSILISVYNGEKYIERCLNCILNQNLNPSDYEIILIDDGSKDGTYILAKEFAKDYNHIKVYTQNNKGLFNTRNRLLGMAKGDYVYNLDIDDVLVENQLSHILEYAIKNDLDLVGFKSKISFEILPDDLKHDEIKNASLFENGESFILSHPNHRVEVWWYLVKKSFLKDNGICFEDNQNNADVLFTYEVLLNVGKMGYFDWISHYYYQSLDSIMRSNSFHKNLNLVNTMHAMILSINDFSQHFELKKNKSKIASIVRQRLTHFAFGNLVMMIRIGLSLNFIKAHVKQLKEINVYPLNIQFFSKMSFKVKFFAILLNSIFIIQVGTVFFRLKKML